MQTIPDFLCVPSGSVDGGLCRKDLADLRLCVRHPEGLQVSDFPSYDGIWRLVGSEMLVRRGGMYFATEHGTQVAKANASCADGSEARRRPPAYFRAVREGIPSDDLVGDVSLAAFTGGAQ
jgi:hypothetical protein